MHPEIKKLIELQEVDCEIMRLREELTRYPQIRKTRLGEVERAKEKVREAEAEIAELEKRVRETERQVQEWRDDLKRFELQQSQVKDQKSYDALTHEIEQTHGKIAEADEHGAEYLIHEEELDDKLGELTKSLAAKQRECDEEIRRVDEREAEKNSLLERFETRRAQITSGVDPTILRRYERMLTLHPGSTVVPAEDNHCGGCHININSRIHQSLQDPDTITECDSCHRFIYLPE